MFLKIIVFFFVLFCFVLFFFLRNHPILVRSVYCVFAKKSNLIELAQYQQRLNLSDYFVLNLHAFLTGISKLHAY